MTHRHFSVGIEFPVQLPISASVAAAIEYLGIDYLNYICASFPSNASREDGAAISREMLAFVQQAGLDYSISAQVVDPSDEAIRLAADASSDAAHFEGMLFDELEHWRLMYPNMAVPLVDNASLTSLPQAYEVTLAALVAFRARFAALGVHEMVATLFWPDMLQLAARAGFSVCPKICKETYSTVNLAIGMGAALQYDQPLWADVDLWYWNVLPGHPPEEVRSNLLLAYWAGVDRVYLEGAGYNLALTGEAGLPFSLMTQITSDRYTLTPIGEVLRWFCSDYVPNHPRPWSFRDLTPDIAIVRFPDSCHGQRYSAISSATEPWGACLYGSPQLHSTPDTEAWLGLWNLLTRGKSGHDGLTHFKSSVLLTDPVSWTPQRSYADPEAQCGTHTFFTPLNNTVVFDHLVTYERLKGIPLLFLTGVEVSADTLTALRRCAEEGATVIAWGPLARKVGLLPWETGTIHAELDRGLLVATDDFSSMDAARCARDYVGRYDEIRYRFLHDDVRHDVVLTRVDDNAVTVECT